MPGNGGEELRYSLRSLSNLPHGRVWVVGQKCPKWCSDEVGFIYVRESGDKWRNLPRAILAAVRNDEVAEDFALFNDDFFVLRELEALPVYHKGPLAEAAGYKRATGSYGRGYRETEKLLRALGVTRELVNYELHVPLPVRKAWMRDVLEVGLPKFKGRVLQTRTLYGNVYDIGGERLPDVKVFLRKWGNPGADFVSTNDQSFADRQSPVRRAILAAFPTACEYERKK
jgi:hypothetical protein